MKEVHKKSIDPAVNQILLTAYRQQTPLVWTRAEAMQPQCSFGRLAICCGDCQEGPCRVNPFSDVAQQSICGRDKQELAMGHLLRKATDGALALGKLAAESGHALGEAWGQQLLVVDDEMLVFESASERLQIIGRCTNKALESLRQYQEEVSGVRQPSAIGVNIG
ncbi:MAG TPA: hypothetical protein VN631_02005, partial [Negativicutes bacterium]|nr:hypothetical protein [Negativicutes bacterium]